jgi:hypothetical protein
MTKDVLDITLRELCGLVDQLRQVEPASTEYWRTCDQLVIASWYLEHSGVLWCIGLDSKAPPGFDPDEPPPGQRKAKILEMPRSSDCPARPWPETMSHEDEPKGRRSMKSLAVLLLLVLGSLCAVASAQTRPVVLIAANTETDSATSAAGAATNVGGVVVAGGGANTSTYEHSEIWEVYRRFSDECPAASFVTNPQTPHSLTIHTDYQKVSSLMTGTVVLYQLVLLDGANNPLYVSKKNWLRREIKPICKVIAKQQ